MRKKRVISIILLICMCLMMMADPIKANASSVPKVEAKAYTVTDGNTGKVMYSKNANKKIYPASTAKLMTALVAVEHMKLDKKITVSKQALNLVPADAAKIGLKAGSKYTLNQLLHMLLLTSAADAAETIAIAVGGSQKKFSNMMNQKAKSLGMTHTSFDNPIGLDKGNKYYRTYSTANDMSKLARYAMKVNSLKKIVSKSKYTLSSLNNKKRTLHNTNHFLTVAAYKRKAYTVIGTKTGYTNAAGACLIVTAVNNSGRKIICSYYGASTHTQMYQEISSLLDYAFQH